MKSADMVLHTITLMRQNLWQTEVGRKMRRQMLEMERQTQQMFTQSYQKERAGLGSSKDRRRKALCIYGHRFCIKCTGRGYDLIYICSNNQTLILRPTVIVQGRIINSCPPAIIVASTQSLH